MILWVLSYAVEAAIAGACLGMILVAWFWWDDLTPRGRLLIPALMAMIAGIVGGFAPPA